MTSFLIVGCNILTNKELQWSLQVDPLLWDTVDYLGTLEVQVQPRPERSVASNRYEELPGPERRHVHKGATNKDL